MVDAVVVAVGQMMNISSVDHECPPPRQLVAFYYLEKEIDMELFSIVFPRILTFCTVL
jgi:hypothetical protein